MLSDQLAAQINLIELRAKKILSGNLQGDYHTVLKGTGLEFDQIREYDPSDDVRFIDWKSSARTGKLLTKQYLDERNRTVMIMLDVSSSLSFGDKWLNLSQAAALLAAVAHYSKDRVGLMLFADQVVHYLAPSKGLAQLAAIYQAIFGASHSPAVTLAQAGLKDGHYTTSLNTALDGLIKNLGREQALVFLVSDLLDQRDFSRALRIAAQQHDLIALRALDAQELELPDVGLILLTDPETGASLEIDLAHLPKLNQQLQQRAHAQVELFRAAGAELLNLYTQEQLVPALIQLFQQRRLY